MMLPARLIGLLLAMLAAMPLMADVGRPKVGLVLSGGGAKGMAHVGVLRVLEELKVPVDIVVGTSAGSAVGALYASGMEVQEIEERFIEMDWVSSFRDDPGRAYKPVRRKRQDWRYPVSPGIGVRMDGLHLGGGIIAGQNLGFILNELTRDAALVEDFDELAIPFRAVATDLETGEEVVIGSGNLSEAIRASMSIPGVYAPVTLNGRLLVDGGVANNLPVSVAHELGADIVIAVDITDPLLEREDIREAFSVVGQLTTMMTRQNTERQLKLLDDQDILMRPDLQGLSSADFYEAPALFELGASSARGHAGELRHLSVSDDEWDRFRGRLKAHSFNPGVITDIRIDDRSRLAGDFLRERIRQQTGEPLDVDALEEDLKRIYGLGYYETVSYSLVPTDGPGTDLVIRVREKSWGPNYLSFGLNYEDNFENDTRFNVATSLRMTGLNALGGEWTTGLQLGTQPRVRTEWFQPLDYGFERFLTLGGAYSRESLSAFDGEGERITEVDITNRQVDLALGTASWRRASITGLLYANAVTKGVAGIENSVLLGGFHRLSAYSQGEVAGEDAALAGVFVRQEFGGPFVPWFAGAGFETGNAWSSLGEARWNNLLRSGSLFAGVETFLGPVQIATAYNNRDDWSAYLNVGFSFTRLFE
ncbi:patatin-like phospholipase family protein [Marinobacter sp.]|uniref:patatin-like phospholipase family protein n=1 Tax=Marinobacter sp. TaxID=50741 RepID=UPI00258AD170|nr:patatin-like phospholipase family protein [Marinobacter sp.]